MLVQGQGVEVLAVDVELAHFQPNLPAGFHLPVDACSKVGVRFLGCWGFRILDVFRVLGCVEGFAYGHV